MNSNEIVNDQEIESNLKQTGFTGYSVKKGRLILLELLSKSAAGYYNSHTEENYLRFFGLTQKNRLPNKRGRKFICAMVYGSSNERPDAYKLMQEFRV